MSPESEIHAENRALLANMSPKGTKQSQSDLSNNAISTPNIESNNPSHNMLKHYKEWP